MGKEFVEFDAIESPEYQGIELELSDELIEVLVLLEASAGILSTGFQARPGMIDDRWLAHQWGEVAANAGIPLDQARLLTTAEVDYDCANAYDNWFLDRKYSPEQCLATTGVPF
jgi:hypothetical protein